MKTEIRHFVRDLMLGNKSRFDRDKYISIN